MTAKQLADILTGRYDDAEAARHYAARLTALLDPAAWLVLIVATGTRWLVWVHPRTEAEKIAHELIESGALAPEAMAIARERLGYPPESSARG